MGKRLSKRRSLSAGSRDRTQRMSSDNQHQWLDLTTSRSSPTGVADDVGAESNNERQTNDATEEKTQRGKYSETIQRLHSHLMFMMDIEWGLLDKLITLDVVTQNEADEVQNERTRDSRTAQLLNLVMKKPDAQQEQFLNALDNNQHTHVSEYIRANGELESLNEDKWPLVFCDEYRMLEKNYYMLTEAIDLRCGLLDELFIEGYINRQQMIAIKAERTDAAQNRLLLSMTFRKSFADFSKLLICLLRTKQSLVVSLLSSSYTCSDQPLSDAAKSRLRRHHAKLVELIDTKCGLLDELRASGCITQRQREYITWKEEDTTAGLLDILSRGSEADFNTFVDSLRNTGQEHVVRMLVEDVVVAQIVAKTRSSVDEERLIVERFMAVISNSSHQDRENMYTELTRLLNELRSRHPARLESTANSICSLHVDKLPSELLQLTLNKAMGQLFVIIHRVIPLAAVYVMATLGGVSTLWWRTITCRQYNKRVLKRYFQRVCSPFKCNLRRLQSLQFEKNVICSTEFNGQLYVGIVGSASVQVIVSRPPFSRLDDITVQGLNAPMDIVVCKDTSQLYIADGGSQYAIWRVNLLCYKQVDKFITIQWWPWSLSVNSRRLLITPYDGYALFLYSDDGSVLNHIKLPDYMLASHAVETTHNTYIVSHDSRYNDDTQSGPDSVSEVNVDGRVVRTFNSQNIDIYSIQFNAPCYLALDDNNHVIVADSRSERVVVLNEDLKLKRVLMTSLGQQPMRLCLRKSPGIMFINYLNSDIIDIMLVEDSVVAQIVANTRSCTDEERLIAESFMAELLNSAHEDRENMYTELQRLMNELMSRDRILIGAPVQH